MVVRLHDEVTNAGKASLDAQALEISGDVSVRERGNLFEIGAVCETHVLSDALEQVKPLLH